MPSWAQRSASPYHVKSPFDRDDEIIPIRGHGPEPRVWTGFHIPVYQNLAGLVQDTDGQRPGVQVDPTRRLMLLGVASPEVSSSSEGWVPNASSPTAVCRGGGLNTYHRAGADAAHSAAPLSSMALGMRRSKPARCWG